MVAILAALALILSACGPGVAEEAAGAVTPSVTVDELVGNLDAYTGKQVTISGEVESVLGGEAPADSAFTLDTDATGTASDDESILVFSAKADNAFTANEIRQKGVTVRGTAHKFDLAALEEELGYVLTEDVFRDWQGRPALVASSVTVQP